MRKDPLFFIAVLPPANLQLEVTAFKEYIADRWGARHALKSPPHLTLQPPFAWPESDLGRLKKCLANFAALRPSFVVQLSGFGAFPPGVIFVKSLKNKALALLFQNLVTCLDRELAFSDPRNRRPFHPHMTIAHRDLAAGDFPEMWAYFQEKEFERPFDAQGVTLLRSVQGKWHREADFPFQKAIQ